MEKRNLQIDSILAENEELKNQLFEAKNIIQAIKDGAIDALIVNNNGKPNIYSLESADYTYRVLIEKFGEGALSISEEGIILYCNEYFSKLVNIPARKIIGTFFNSYVESVGRFEELQQSLSSGLSKGEIILNVHGSKIPVYISLTNLQPTLAAIGIIVTDLSEKRKHEEALALNQKKLENKIAELNEANNDLERFIHIISHDIKEPIRKIATYSSLLTISKNSEEELEKINNLQIINKSAVRLNSLVDDLVKYSLSASKINPIKIDLNDIAKEVIEDLELVINENSAGISLKALPVIEGSPVQLRQLFSNILTNALKYRKDKVKPKIKIVSEIKNSVLPKSPNKKFHKISISDNGIGMDQEYLKKIFTIFQRLHKQDEYKGNGIGLAICKKIMENHSGTIEARSTLGEGSTFNIYFPVNG
ncbi:MAG: ATP-binding protein [Bacteroidota bacterium]